MKQWGVMLAAGIVLAGCSEQAGTDQSQDKTVTVQADELFKGELKTLQLGKPILLKKMAWSFSRANGKPFEDTGQMPETKRLLQQKNPFKTRTGAFLSISKQLSEVLFHVKENRLCVHFVVF